jgi:transposase-like protein
MYARGMSTREIVGYLRDLYGIEVSPYLMSAVTDAVLEGSLAGPPAGRGLSGDFL